MTGVTESGSISEFSKDQEFIEFLKNISLYVTNDEDDSHDSKGILYKNLRFLKEKFQEFKYNKSISSQTQSELVWKPHKQNANIISKSLLSKSRESMSIDQYSLENSEYRNENSYRGNEYVHNHNV